MTRAESSRSCCGSAVVAKLFSSVALLSCLVLFTLEALERYYTRPLLQKLPENLAVKSARVQLASQPAAFAKPTLPPCPYVDAFAMEGHSAPDGEAFAEPARASGAASARPLSAAARARSQRLASAAAARKRADSRLRPCPEGSKTPRGMEELWPGKPLTEPDRDRRCSRSLWRKPVKFPAWPKCLWHLKHHFPVWYDTRRSHPNRSITDFTMQCLQAMFREEKCKYNYTFENVSSFLKYEMRLALPDAPPTGFKSCAMVYSGGSLLLSPWGGTIDKYDMVMRFNSAPIDGYEAHVGSRTHIRVLGSSSCQDLVQARANDTPRCWCSQLAQSNLVFNNLVADRPSKVHPHCELFSSVCGGYVDLISGDGGYRNLRPEVFHQVANGEAVRALGRALPRAQQSPTVGTSKKHYTSGGLGLLMSQALCPNGIDIYGYGQLALAGHPIKYHYYDDSSPNHRVDSLNASGRILETIVKNEPDCIRFQG